MMTPAELNPLMSQSWSVAGTGRHVGIRPNLTHQSQTLKIQTQSARKIFSAKDQEIHRFPIDFGIRQGSKARTTVCDLSTSATTVQLRLIFGETHSIEWFRITGRRISPRKKAVTTTFFGSAVYRIHGRESSVFITRSQGTLVSWSCIELTPGKSTT